MIKVAIVEDEKEPAETLTSYLERYGQEEDSRFDITHFTNAVTLLDGYKPAYDVIFMDVLLPDMNGMDAAAKLRELDKKIILVFVTNMAQFAVKGYEVDALDFIVKPLTYDSFAMKMERIMRARSRNFGKVLKIFYDGNVKLISVNEVSRIEVMNHDLYYHTDAGVVRARGSLGELEKQLQPYDFVRCSVSCLVNLRYVKDICGDNIYIGGEAVRISRAKKKEFLQRLADYLGKGA